MELRQLEHFVAVVDEGQFTRAARRVHIGQSALSSSIRALERDVGTALLSRGSRTLTLTEAGLAFLPAARRALAASDEGRQAVGAVLGLLRGRLALGVVQGLGVVDLPVVLDRFHRLHPDVTMQWRSGTVPAFVGAVADGELDVALVDRSFDDDRVMALSLGAESLVLAVSAADPRAHLDSVALAELDGCDFVDYRIGSGIRTTIDEVFSANGIRRHTCCEVDTMTGMAELVGAGVASALVPPRALVGSSARAVSVEPPIEMEYVAVVPASRAPSPTASELIRLLTESTSVTADAAQASSVRSRP